MRKFFALIIGLTITLGSIHFIPTHVMANEMGEMSGMNHCFLCSEENRQSTNECPPNESGETNNKVSFNNLIPFGHNCDCDFKQGKKNHNASILKSKSKQIKQKIFTVVLPKFEFVLKKKTHAISQKSFASVYSYLKAHKTIQKLE